jgi:cytochrome c-type biogenesis protein CcmH
MNHLPMDYDIPLIKRQLQQLGELRDAGALTPEQYEQSKTLLERRILDRVLSDDFASPAPVPLPEPELAAAPLAGHTPEGASTPPLPNAVEPIARPEGLDHKAPAGPGRPSRTMLAALAAGVLVVAGAGYWWTARPLAGNTAGTEPEAAAAPHDTSADQMGAMIDKLAARLKDNPNDAAGWGMLARSFSVVGRTDEAVAAYAKAAEIGKDDAALLADYADALAVKNNRTLTGEPMKLVERALKADPRNVKALALAGTDAFNRKDYLAAVKAWEQVVEFGGADNLFVQQVQGSLGEARQLAGLPPAPKPATQSLADFAGGAAPAPAAAASASKPAPASANATVRGVVTLAAALASKAAAGDTVFVTARAPEGSRMPLAIIRKQVKDLPLSFVLDDSLAMSPAARLSGASKVIVTARVSKSGNAMPQPGDLVGQSAPIAVGTTNLALEIHETVKP